MVVNVAISRENQEKLKYLWDDDNTVDWIESFIQIADKEGNIVPFILTPEQRYFVENMGKDNIVLKSRQLGLSVCVIALSIRSCIVQDNTTCVLISHNQTSTNSVFAKLKQQFYSLPEFIKPKLLTNNRQELAFANGSKVTCMTCGTKPLLRGETVNGICHLSEFAFYKNPEEQMKSISQAISSSGKVIIESTANGFNKFSETYYQAKNGENTYKPFFFNWIKGKTLFNKQYQQAVDRYVAVNGCELSKDNLDDEELRLLDIGASIPQLTWRRQKIATDGLDTFKVEFPSTDNECFLTTGSQVFDTNRIDKSIKGLLDNKVKYITKDKIIGLPMILKNLYPKSLQIYSIPKSGVKYYIGCDCSEGLGRDYSTAIVLNKDGKQVAEFRNNQLKPYQLADIFDALGRYYNKALLTVEKASGGHSVIERLRYDKYYMNMTKYCTYDEYNRAIWKVGFDTNNKTKSIIVNDAREWFEKGLIQIKSKELLEELKVFVANDKGGMGAIIGQNDDLVMGLCLCIAGIKNNVWYPF